MKRYSIFLFVVIMTFAGCGKKTQAGFQNPIFPKCGPDPWTIFHDGNYYYMHTCGNCLKLWVTPDITDVWNAPCKTIWTPTDSTNMFDLWAPEIHYINDKWYVYYAADDGNTDNHQLYVLENENENPFDGEFQLKGRISTDPDNNWAIDGSVFQLGDQLYMVWSGWQTRRVSTETQCIYIARMENPWTLSSERVLISKPELEWERHWVNENGWTPSYTIYVNEGPQPLRSPDGKLIHIAYSASGCWTPYYALGLLTASVDDNLLDPASWKKSPQPVFRQKPEAGVYGTGHASFFLSPDGKESYILYHARSTETDPEGMGDTRSPRMQRFEWSADGYPIFGEPISTDSLLPKPSGTPVIKKTWQPAECAISTTWGENIDPTNVLPEYPRPQLQRQQWQNLNGLWQYAVREEGKPCPLAWDGQILVPFCIESSLSGVGKALPAGHALWYQRTFSVPDAWKNKHLCLNFGAVDWKAQVYVNGSLAGEHTGGYTPFSIDITPFLTAEKQQTLTVCVVDPSDRGFQPRGKQVSNPNGIWYTSVSGIWQTVWMEPVAENHITAVKSIPCLEDGTISVTVSSSGMSENDNVEISLFADQACVASASGRVGEPVLLSISNPKLWSPYSPYLYDMKISLNKGEDEVTSYTAMRSITKAKDADGIWRMQLNGRNLFQYGPLDQGWWPDGLYTAPSDEALVYDIQTTKDLGFNMIRKHVKVEPERWYYHCDRLGMLVWQDMPSGDLGNKWEPHSYIGGTDRQRTEDSKNNYYAEWKEILDFGISHPSIVVWVPFNEAWGQFDTKAVTEFTKQYDPSRLVNPASGGNFVRTGDILDLHNYPAPKMYLFDPDRVNVLGEYGGIGLPLEGHLWWNNRNWGYIKFTNSNEVTAEYVKYAEQLAKLVPAGFSAAVYTQTSDVEGEVNGLMTYDRKVLKVNQDFVSKINHYVISQLSSGQQLTKSGLNPDNFQDEIDGKKTALYTLTNLSGMEVCITNFGGRIVSLLVPDKNGKMRDVVLGFDNIKDYENVPTDFGAAIGRYANRIDKGQITIDGKQYQLLTNNYGHTLHGGPTGWQYQVYQAEQPADNILRLTILSPDGDNGFPGNVTAKCTYTLSDDNTLRIDYSATTDAPTVINMTNHSYFNLHGDGNQSVLDHLLWLNAKQMTPVDNTFMTTGQITDIPANSPFDFFSKPKTIGQDIEADNTQLANGHGYDHNWVLLPADNDNIRLAATLACPESGIKLAVLTNEPGIQVYTGNFLDGTVIGKRAETYGHRHAVCLETQKYPNTPNNPDWPSALLRPGQTYNSTTIFQFTNE